MPARAERAAAASVKVSVKVTSRPRLRQDFLAFLKVCAQHSNHHGLGRLMLLVGHHYPSRRHVAAKNAAENVHQHLADLRIRQDDAHCGGNLLFGRPATHVQEVSGSRSRRVGHVQRGHGEAGAVHQAAHAAVQADVCYVVVRGPRLKLVFLAAVPQLVQVRMPEQRVVLNVHLGVQRHHVCRPR